MQSIYTRGTHSCTGCDWAKEHNPVQRTFDLHENRWRFYRSCHWCGCCYPATAEDWNAENPDLRHSN